MRTRGTNFALGPLRANRPYRSLRAIRAGRTDCPISSGQSLGAGGTSFALWTLRPNGPYRSLRAIRASRANCPISSG